MWILNMDGFFSAVEHCNKPDHLMVRARCKDDSDRLPGVSTPRPTRTRTAGSHGAIS